MIVFKRLTQYCAGDSIIFKGLKNIPPLRQSCLIPKFLTRVHFKIMWRKILDSLENYSLEDLHQLKNRLELLIQKKTYALESKLDKRTGHRANVKITGTVEIEREKEFFDHTHKVHIHEMSTSGLTLTIPATVVENDILSVTFRLPSNGDRKVIDCQAIRVKEISTNNVITYEVAAQAVDKSAVKAYRNMLKNRGN